MADLKEAIALLEAGDWEAAHVIVQDGSGRLEAWAHGIVHLLEGDHDNARYWYRQARRPWPDTVNVPEELAALRHDAGI